MCGSLQREEQGCARPFVRPGATYVGVLAPDCAPSFLWKLARVCEVGAVFKCQVSVSPLSQCSEQLLGPDVAAISVYMAV